MSTLNLDQETEHAPEPGKSHASHLAMKLILLLLAGWACLPVFGIGLWKNSSGDLSFDLWYLIVFMLIAFLLMHEFITPLPARDRQ
jgi:hypothetical protein